MRLRIDTGEGPFELDTTLHTIVLWERKFKRKASDMAAGMGIEDLAYMAYEASKANNVTVPVAFDDYVKSLTSLEVVDQEPARPT